MPTVKDNVLKVTEEATGKSEEELEANLDADLNDDLKLTSLEYFPILSGLEDTYDVDIDYADFLTKVKTLNQAIAYVEALV